MTELVNKVSKAAADYRDRPMADTKWCGICWMYRAPTPGSNGACTLVEGPISYYGWCTRWIEWRGGTPR